MIYTKLDHALHECAYLSLVFTSQHVVAGGHWCLVVMVACRKEKPCGMQVGRRPVIVRTMHGDPA